MWELQYRHLDTSRGSRFMRREEEEATCDAHPLDAMTSAKGPMSTDTRPREFRLAAAHPRESPAAK